MDASYEDKMYRQIEKSLSNNSNDKLFIPIEMIDENTYKGRKSKRVVDSVSFEEKTVQGEEPLFLDSSSLYYDSMKDNTTSNNNVSNNVQNNNISSSNVAGNNTAAIEEYKEDGPRLSRAEYIRQAREACLRQMNTLNSPGRISDAYTVDEDLQISSHGKKKKDKTSRLFYEGSDEDVLPEEIASFKSLIIRTVCAVVIFICIFLIDKVKLDWGAFSHETIREYVTGNNQLKVLEELIVTWLK